MATHLVAGCVAVLREVVISRGVQVPSAALIKALLINGTVDIRGKDDATAPTQATPAAPDGLQGFGRVQMTRSIAALSGEPGCGFVDAGEGKTVPSLTPSIRSWESVPIEIRRPNTSLVLTLAYSDREGQLLQNDLNLIVRDAHGEERHGNCSFGSQYDTQNNVEKVIWEGIDRGFAYVQVEAVGGFARFNCRISMSLGGSNCILLGHRISFNINDPQGFSVVWAVW